MSASGTHTVLIVDDDAAVLRALRRALERAGCRVLSTSEGPRALELLIAEQVDVLITDLDMPVMRGEEVAARARALRPDAVRIVLTGRANLESALHAINEGEVFRFLTKPWRDDELRETLEEAVRRSGELRRASAAARATERRERLLAALEREHPGVTALPPEGAAYPIEEARVLALAARLPPDLRALIESS